ncbi:MAG TPA: Rieske 2Fe-2S domain-containing protein [Acidimicrobiales bacterium]|nr:Rieske 2Fe-2S domain-containing protein [Acidimicrobiales bacterium]
MAADAEGADAVTGSPAVTRPPADPRKWAAWARSFPGGHLLVLRAFLGVTFCYAGLQKLATRGFFEASNPASIQAQLKASALVTPVGHLLGPAIHVAVLLGLLISFGELAVGLGTLLGLYSRVAAGGGMLLALLFFLTVSYNSSPYYYGPDIVFFFAWTPLALNGAGALSLDAVLAARHARERAAVAPAAATAIDRRAAVAKVAASALVGAVALFLGGVAAAAGRVLGRRPTAMTGPTFPSSPSSGGTAPTTSPAAAGGAPSTTGAGSPKGPKGKRLGPASAVAVGGAVGFTDPFQGIPAYVVQPKTGEYLGFSAVCTHAGCTVAFVQAVEQFQCPCHGSIYSAVTGDVIQGPAPLPLPAIGIEVSGGELYVTD